MGENISLGYPNQEVKISFHEVLFKYLYDAEYHVYSFGRMLGEALREEKLEEVKGLINGIFSSIPYSVYPKTDELERIKEYYYHTIMYLSLSLLGYDARTELLSSKGRLDMAVIYRDKVYVMEFKVGKGAEDAISQIKQKGYADRFRAEGKRVILCGISFNEKDKKIEDIRFEDCY